MFVPSIPFSDQFKSRQENNYHPKQRRLHILLQLVLQPNYPKVAYRIGNSRRIVRASDRYIFLEQRKNARDKTFRYQPSHSKRQIRIVFFLLIPLVSRQGLKTVTIRVPVLETIMENRDEVIR